MEPMRHGYTNHTVSDGRVAVKTYAGPDRAARQEREERALRSLAGVLPVPVLLDTAPGTSTTAFIARGARARGYCRRGRRRSPHRLRPAAEARPSPVDPRRVYDDVDDAGVVLVHNHFGPNNIVMGADLADARLLCDLEWTTIGNRNTDLAWAEFIAPYHHPESVPALNASFEGYQAKPTWGERQEAMAARAVVQRDFVRRWQGRERATPG